MAFVSWRTRHTAKILEMPSCFVCMVDYEREGAGPNCGPFDAEQCSSSAVNVHHRLHSEQTTHKYSLQAEQAHRYAFGG